VRSQHEAGGGDQGVPPLRHGRATRVRSLAGEPDGQARHRDDLTDHPEREVAVGQRRALLDVQLDEDAGKRLHAASRQRGRQAQRGEGPANARSAGITHVQLGGSEPTAQRPAAEVALSEPAAFLVAEGNDPDSPRVRPRAGGGDRLQPGHHAEGAVEPAAVRDGIEMGPGPDFRELRGAPGRPADQVANRVDSDLEPSLGHPACREVVSPLLGEA